jgi:hypothetical protein
MFLNVAGVWLDIAGVSAARLRLLFKEVKLNRGRPMAPASQDA